MTGREALRIGADGVTLAADRWRGHGPPVVLLHSGVTDRRSWWAVAGRLAGGHDVIAYDRRGFGETAAHEGVFSDVADLGAVLELADAPVWLAGNSQGGRIALDAALRYPDRIAGMVLIGAVASGIPDDAPYTMDERTAALEQRYEAATRSGDAAERGRVAAWLWLDGANEPEGRVAGAPRELLLEMVADMTRADEWSGRPPGEPAAWPQLERIEVPASIVVGDYDTFLIPIARDLAARLPHAELSVMPGTAHLPMLDQPEQTAAIIAGAVRGYSSAA